MDDKIYNELMANLEYIEKQEKEKTEKENKLVNLKTQKLYCEIWKQIIKNITKQQGFTLSIFFKGPTIFIKIGKDIKKKMLYKKISLDVLKEQLQQDGLEFHVSYINKGTECKIPVTKSKLKIVTELYEANQKKLK